MSQNLFITYLYESHTVLSGMEISLFIFVCSFNILFNVLLVGNWNYFFFIFDIVSLYQKMTNITSKVLVNIFLKVCSTSMLLVLPLYFYFLGCTFYSLWMFSMKALASVGDLLFNALAANETVKQISRCGALNSVHQSDLHINTCNLWMLVYKTKVSFVDTINLRLQGGEIIIDFLGRP